MGRRDGARNKGEGYKGEGAFLLKDGKLMPKQIGKTLAGGGGDIGLMFLGWGQRMNGRRGQRNAGMRPEQVRDGGTLEVCPAG